jgi:hypothetical protein
LIAAEQCHQFRRIVRGGFKVENTSNISELDFLLRGVLVAFYGYIWNQQEVVYLQAVRGERRDPLVRAEDAEAIGRKGIS